MPVRLQLIVVDAHDLPGLARFWTQALGWRILSDREREIVIGTGENAPVGMCFLPVTDVGLVGGKSYHHPASHSLIRRASPCTVSARSTTTGECLRLRAK
jgi:hypothetical protein